MNKIRVLVLSFTMIALFSVAPLGNGQQQGTSLLCDKAYKLRDFIIQNHSWEGDSGASEDQGPQPCRVKLNLKTLKQRLGLEWEVLLLDGEATILFFKGGRLFASLETHMRLKRVTDHGELLLEMERPGMLFRATKGWLIPEDKGCSEMIQVW